jgi:hypothetical protein
VISVLHSAVDVPLINELGEIDAKVRLKLKHHLSFDLA